MSIEATLVPDLELPAEAPFEQLSALGAALESFHRELTNRTYQGGSNPVAEAVLNLATVTSLENYDDSAFGPALEAAQNRFMDVILRLLAYVKEKALKLYNWFKELFKPTLAEANANLETKLNALTQLDEAIKDTPEVKAGIHEAESEPEDPEAKITRTKDAFVESFSSGIGAAVVKLSFKEDPWLKFLASHVKLCVRITKEVTHSDDLFGAVVEQRKSLKGQLVGDVRKATEARQSLAKSLGLDTEDTRTVVETIRENVRFIHLLTHNTSVKVNPQFILTNSPAVASMILAMDSKEYRQNAEQDLGDAEKRLADVEAGIERIEKQISSRGAELESEDSEQLREWIKELQLAASGLHSGSQFHINYVKAHTRIIDSFTNYYRAVAEHSAQKHSADTLVKFNKQFK